MASLSEIANNMLRISGGDVALFERTTDAFARNLESLPKTSAPASSGRPATAKK